VAGFGCFVSGGDFVAMFWSLFLVIKAKRDQISFFCLIYGVNDFLTDIHEKIEVIGQIRWE